MADDELTAQDKAAVIQQEQTRRRADAVEAYRQGLEKLDDAALAAEYDKCAAEVQAEAEARAAATEGQAAE